MNAQIYDISNWSINNTSDISYLFYNFSSLKKVPDIYKRKIDENMGNLFNGCESLKALPGLSKWNTSKNTSMECSFYFCLSLTSLSDISKWDTTNAISINRIFQFCSSLIKLPEI